MSDSQLVQQFRFHALWLGCWYDDLLVMKSQGHPLTRSTGVIGGILANPAFLNDIGNPTDSRYITWIAAGILLGDVVGLLCLSAVSFRIGRKTTIVVCCVVALVGVALQTATQSPIEILTGRVVLGLANGRK